MKTFAYMVEWFFVLVAIAGAIGIASLAYWVWNSEKDE